MNEGEIFVVFITVVAGTSVIHGVIRTIGKYFDTKLKLHSGSEGSEGILADLEVLKDRVARHSDVEERVSDLEERVEFAERLLAKKSQREIQ